MYRRSLLPALLLLSLLPSLPAKVELIAYLRMDPPLQVLQRATIFGNEVDPSGQANALPFFIGQFLGDPTLQSLDPSAALGVFVYADIAAMEKILEEHGFDGGEDVPEPEFHIVGLGKIAEDSPMSMHLEQNLQMTLEARDGWTLVAQKPEALDLITDLGPLLQIMEDSAAPDLQLQLVLGALKPLLDDICAAVREDMSTTHGMTNPFESAFAEAYLDIFLGELASLTRLGLELKIDATAITWSYAAAADPETALGRALSAEAGGEVPASRGLDQTSTYALWKYPTGALLDYTDHILDKLAKQDFYAPYVQKLRESYTLARTHQGDSYAATLDVEELLQMDFGSLEAPDDLFALLSELPLTCVLEGTFTDAQLIRYIELTIDANEVMLDGVFEAAMEEATDEETREELKTFLEQTGDLYRFDRNVGEAAGKPIHFVAYDMSSLAAMDPIMGTENLQLGAYVAVHDGDVLAHPNLERLKALLARRSTGHSVLGSQTLPEGTAFELGIDARPFLTLAAEGMLPEAMFDEFQQLTAQYPSQPAGFFMTAGDAQGRVSLSLPASLLRDGMTLSRMINQAQMEKGFDEDSGDPNEE